MKIDFTGQAILWLALLGAIWGSSVFWTVFLLILLSIWQLASSIEMDQTYQYRAKGRFWRILLLVAAGALFLRVHLPGLTTLIWLSLLTIYLAWTARDTCRVIHRPRSFWDLG